MDLHKKTGSKHAERSQETQILVRICAYFGGKYRERGLLLFDLTSYGSS